MLGIVARRLIWLVFVLLGVTLLTFVISRVIPGDPALLMAGPDATPDIVEKVRHLYGLDRPLPEQYLGYVEGVLRGDFGTSITTSRPVGQELAAYLPATVELMFCAMILSLVLGIGLGVAAALNRDRPIDHVIRVVSVAGISTPSFWLALLLLLLFYGVLGWAPGPGRLDMSLDLPDPVTGFLLIDSLLAGRADIFSNALAHLALPAVTLAILQVGGAMRLVRGAMIEVLSEDYIRTARAYGLSRAKVVLRYALPNALIPFLTVFGLELAGLIFGSVVIESIFGWPGIGAYVLQAIFGLDFPVIMGFTFMATVAYVTANLLVDLLHAAIDPRVRSVG